MMSDAQQNDWKLVTSNIASARNQWYSNDADFWLAQITLYAMA